MARASPSGIAAAVVGTCIANRRSAGRASAAHGASQNHFWPNTKKSSELVKYAIATECKPSSRILSDRCRDVRLVDCVTSQQSGQASHPNSIPASRGGRKKIQMPRSLTKRKQQQNSPAAGGPEHSPAGRSCNAPEIGRYAKKKGKPHPRCKLRLKGRRTLKEAAP
jgi:hypothetical protein